MKALTWQGNQDVQVTEVPDPRIEEPTDAIVRVTSTAICGSDLHLYGVLGPYLTPGDVLGHEAMGIVEDVGAGVSNLSVGDRVVVPFNISCGHCWMCSRGLFAQCETTQVRSEGTGSSLFGYTSLYGSVPGSQAGHLRFPQPQFGPIIVPTGPPDDQFLFLSDALPTAWQAVRYADVPTAGSVAVLGLGPIGQMAVRIAQHLGAGRIIAVDRVPERLALAERYGAETLNFDDVDNLAQTPIDRVEGRGPDATIDAVGMESSHGGRVVNLAQKATDLLPDAIGQQATDTFAMDRSAPLRAAMKGVRRGGTASVSGVYGGESGHMPMMEMFDRGIQLRTGQAHVRRWTDHILPLVLDPADPLGTLDLTTHHQPLSAAPHGYETLRDKLHGCIKVVLSP